MPNFWVPNFTISGCLISGCQFPGISQTTHQGAGIQRFRQSVQCQQCVADGNAVWSVSQYTAYRTAGSVISRCLLFRTPGCRVVSIFNWSHQAAADHTCDMRPFLLLLLLLSAPIAVLLVLQVRMLGLGSSPATRQAFRSSSCSLLA